MASVHAHCAHVYCVYVLLYVSLYGNKHGDLNLNPFSSSGEENCQPGGPERSEHTSPGALNYRHVMRVHATRLNSFLHAHKDTTGHKISTFIYLLQSFHQNRITGVDNRN
jgi:hypothetical protein